MFQCHVSYYRVSKVTKIFSLTQRNSNSSTLSLFKHELFSVKYLDKQASDRTKKVSIKNKNNFKLKMSCFIHL